MHQNGESIKTAIVGAGQMGKALVSQLARMNGIEPSLLVNRHMDRAKEAFRIAGVDENRIFVTNSAARADDAIAHGKYVLSENFDLIRDCASVRAAVDATGNTNAGAVVAMHAISSGKHIVMLNVETDVTVGCILEREAEKAGVVYTGSAGDEPAAVKELYDFARLVGLETLVIGKGKNNAVDLCCTPDSVREEALMRGMSPKMLSSFKDGTKTMVELACMSNARLPARRARRAWGKSDAERYLPGA
jgi:predicted homoserine dehydrogenase-like protein